MNKKFYAGTIAFGIAASFWACGSGEIITPSESDDMMKIVQADSNDHSLIQPVSKEMCPECFVAEEPSSSSKARRTRSSSSGDVGMSSSSQGGFNNGTSSSDSPIFYASSSSYNPQPPASSAYVPPQPVSSSSESGPILPGNDVGTCAPTPAVATLSDKITWSFKRGNDVQATQLINASFSWTFEGATPNTAKVTGATGLSQSVNYTTSGDHGASLVLSIGGAAYSVTCTPVHINGAAITGCKCTAADKRPDVAVGAVWTVSGCSSAGANVTSYTWTGAVSDPATPTVGTASFTKKNEKAAPTVRVANDDNSVVDVQCDEITTVDETDPDYVINGTAAGTFTVGPGSYKMVYACKADQYDQRPIVIEASTSSASGTVGGVKFTVNPNGRAETYKSTTSNKQIDVEITTGTVTVKCG